MEQGACQLISQNCISKTFVKDDASIMIKALKTNYDLLLLVLLILAFLLIAMQRLSTAPIYETDESYTLQVAYEMLTHGKLALPMYRYLGGNIENVWHSFTPLYFALLSGFLKFAGIGVFQGRIFNLLTVVLTLTIVYFIGRRLINWRVGFLAVLFIISDQTVLERSRLLRNDYAAAFFALLAFYLFEIAEIQQKNRFYLFAGLAAGAGAMCHLSIIYMIAAICLLMLLKDGFRIFKAKKLYLFVAGSFVAMAYEIIYDLIDYHNFRLQYRRDDLHFNVLSGVNWWYNLLDEPRRYINWYNAYDTAFQGVPRTLLHLFQLLTIIALIYLLIRLIVAIKRGSAMAEPRTRVFFMTVFIAFFFAIAAHKAGYYMAHLVTWFGLCVGILLNDAFIWIRGLQQKDWRYAKPAYNAGVALIASLTLFYAAYFVRQTRYYLQAVRNPELAQFEEMQSILRSIIPSDVCPVAVKAPVMWLAFQEYDRCFATIENRMKEALDLDGNDYALMMRPKSPEHWARDLPEGHNLIGELRNTAYGNFVIYYTGNRPEYRQLAPQRYRFFGRLRGHVSEEQIQNAREIWAADAAQLQELSGAKTQNNKQVELRASSVRDNGLIEIGSVDLQQGYNYQVSLDAGISGNWQLVILDDSNGVWLEQISLEEEDRIEEYFRTTNTGRVRIALRPLHKDLSSIIRLSRISIREVSNIGRPE